ncbi:phage tail protein [Burkholderia ubonensis]|nr:phage tail protein [Burkholderia ubonensis]
MSVSAASASATLTADEIIVETALGGIRYCLPAFNQTINLATTGASGMDTGPAPTSGFVALYAIYNPTTKTAALLATNSTSAVAPAVYGGANMPAGYIASALVSVWPTNASRQLQVGYQFDRAISLTNAVLVSSSNGTSGTLTYYPLSISSFAPANARYVTGFGGPNYASGASNVQLDVAASSSGIGNLQIVGNGSTGNPVYSPFRVPIITPQTIYYDFFVSTGTSAGGTIYLNGYEF